MHRFLPKDQLKIIKNEDFWRFLIQLIEDMYLKIQVV